MVMQNKKHVRYGFISENISYPPQDSRKNAGYGNTYSELRRTKVDRESAEKQSREKHYDHVSAVPHIAAPPYEKVKHIWED